MEYTKFLKLKKPSRDQFYDIQDANDNADALDTNGEALHARIEDLTGRMVACEEAFTALQTGFADHELRIKAIEDALFTNITGNPFTVRFDTLDGLAVAGVWNLARQRIEC